MNCFTLVIFVKTSNRFRWVFCQLETLRHCLPPSVRRTLDELPESLDKTYERILKEIKKPNRDYARRLFQCLVVAIRPLGVKELAEVLAVDFDDAEGIPKLKPDWRWEDEEQALLTSCSSLIAIVETDDSRVVQFSHFSVKEYLTSARLASSSGEVSRYHIVLEPAHTILAQACLSGLLQAEDRVEEDGVAKSSSLAKYAARYWVIHAQFERVASFLRKPMGYLFDQDKPYFTTWLQLHDIDTRPNSLSSSLHWFAVPRKSATTPLYYAALCGFDDLVEPLVVKHPQHVNTSGGYYVTPLVAALAGRHFQTVKILHQNGAHVDVRGSHGKTPLLSAVREGDLETVKIMLDYEVDVNSQGPDNWTSIHYVSLGSPLSAGPHNSPKLLPDVARLLLEHGADVNARINRGSTTLHVAASYGRVEVVRVLLEHGANLDAEDNKGRTPLHEAADNGRAEIVRMLLEHSADADPKDNEGRTPLHKAVDNERVKVIRELLEHGANVDAKDNKGRTPLHEAVKYGRVDVVRILLEHGANASPKDDEGGTPLHRAVDDGRVEVVRVLLEHGADVDATPLHKAMNGGMAKVVDMLLEQGANVNAKDNEGRTLLHKAVLDGRVDAIDAVRMLIEHGADVDAQEIQGKTPLHEVAGFGRPEVARVLLEHGANVDAKNFHGQTALWTAARFGRLEVVPVLLEHGAIVGAKDNEGRTPFQIASKNGRDEILKLLSAKGVL